MKMQRGQLIAPLSGKSKMSMVLLLETSLPTTECFGISKLINVSSQILLRQRRNTYQLVATDTVSYLSLTKGLSMLFL